MELKDFFLKTALLPNEWKAYKNLFTYFEAEGSKQMPTLKRDKKKKNIWWVVGLGISTAATILLLFALHFPSSKKEFQPLATLTKQHDSMYNTPALSKKTESKKPSRKEDTTKGKPVRTIVGEHPATILALKNEKETKNNIENTIHNSLAPLDKMDDINRALQKFKYFDLMNKYLPNVNISKIAEESIKQNR